MLAPSPAAPSRRLALAALVAGLCTLAASDAGPSPVPIATLPRFMLWAWERPEDLRSAGRDVGVAFLAQTITIDSYQFQSQTATATADCSPGFHVRPRMQPLRVDEGAVLVAVTRIEVRRSGPAEAGRYLPRMPGPPDPPGLPGLPGPTDAIAAAIAPTALLPRVAGVQVDFDATASQRTFYRDLLARLRAKLPPQTVLSMTALASWCVGDDWLGGLPIDEAVPMLFRMGPANEPFTRVALSRSEARHECRGAVGRSTDEPLAVDARRRRVYVFNPKPWTARTIADARREALR
jgi:hypothetical protein